MDRWDAVVTHPYALAALLLSLVFYFRAARRRGWKESRLMNYIFGVLAVAVLVAGLVLARREILKPRLGGKAEPQLVLPKSTAAGKPATGFPEVRRLFPWRGGDLSRLGV